LEVLCFEGDFEGEDEFFFVFPENIPFVVGEQLDFSFLNEIVEELGVVVAEESGHELVDVHAGHVFFGVAE
jgi:hypothetical protein